MSELVSIVIPAWNAERWIASTIESALQQTHQPCEIIVVDDGSTDDTRTIATRFAGRGVKIVSQKNSGASAARNRGLAEARGAFIQFLDADDLLAPEKISRQVARLRAAGDVFVASAEWVRFTDALPDGPLQPLPIWRDMPAIDFLVTCAMDELMFPPVAWLIPRRLCDMAGAWDETLSLNDDGEYMSRVLASSEGIAFTPGSRAYYRSGNPSSYASQRSSKAAVSEMRAWDLTVATMLRLEDSPRTRLAAATGYQRIEAGWLGVNRDISDRAAAREREFGGGAYRFEGGVAFLAAKQLFGWRTAVRARRLSSRFKAGLRG